MGFSNQDEKKTTVYPYSDFSREDPAAFTKLVKGDFVQQ